MMRTVVRVLLGTTLGLLAVVPAAFAKGEPCNAEINKFCKDVKPGEARLIKCLREHDADLSGACRANVNTFSQYQACLDDTVRLCPGMPPSGTQVIKCLRTHRNDLSMECQTELDRLRR
jgi:hypothetical protein